MSRVKRGVTKHARHKKIMKAAKGYSGASSRSYKWAHEAVMHAWAYSYRHGLNLGGVELDRKVLADMAVQDAQGFGKLIDIAKEQLAAA